MRFASRMECLQDKALLNAMELTETEDMISFSAGFPSSETYPVADIKEAFVQVLDHEGEEALSYCSTSGFGKLRELIAKRMYDKFGLDYKTGEVVITSGSQQALDMSSMLFINKGDVVLFETPSYLGAVNALKAYEAELVALPTDREGLILDSLKQALDQYGDRVKLIYVIPDFQNPTGRSWSAERRKQFVDFIADYDIPVIEDAAYSELSFEDKLEKPLSYYDKKGQVVYVGTFSKTFCPGLRVAWLCAKEQLMEKFLILKNAADLSSSAIAQRQMAYYLSHYDLDAHIKKITSLYLERRNLMMEVIDREFPKEVGYVIPKGGLFIWLELPEGKDSRELLKRALAEKVAFIPGGSFYPSGVKNNELRLNFSNMKGEEIIKGMTILGHLTREYLAE
ncbi:PLP-dependent aminotransferase family protein [Anoxybacterium hadale]|uniref:PLP-dependent aminotransferase family protein n=1 Tax=Anoxybacterium hadale TaxID=3408580 RepID=A0ACD1ADD4_9FIRM|nr:PLP-dependent aminotransferase family protein [Clostridiales bacterium]